MVPLGFVVFSYWTCYGVMHIYSSCVGRSYIHSFTDTGLCSLFCFPYLLSVHCLHNCQNSSYRFGKHQLQTIANILTRDERSLFSLEKTIVLSRMLRALCRVHCRSRIRIKGLENWSHHQMLSAEIASAKRGWLSNGFLIFCQINFMSV